MNGRLTAQNQSRIRELTKFTFLRCGIENEFPLLKP